MKELFLYLFTFIVAYIFYLLFVMRRKNVLNKMRDGKEIKYLEYKYGVKVNEKNLKKIANKIFLGNSFILSTTVYVVCLFDNLFIEIIVGLATLFILIIVIYYLIGNYYRKKQGGKKHV